MRFRIYRYDPESIGKPRMQDYEIEFDPRDPVVHEVEDRVPIAARAARCDVAGVQVAER